MRERFGQRKHLLRGKQLLPGAPSPGAGEAERARGLTERLDPAQPRAPSRQRGGHTSNAKDDVGNRNILKTLGFPR